MNKMDNWYLGLHIANMLAFLLNKDCLLVFVHERSSMECAPASPLNALHFICALGLGLARAFYSDESEVSSIHIHPSIVHRLDRD
jgi:hypothetical protein